MVRPILSITKASMGTTKGLRFIKNSFVYKPRKLKINIIARLKRASILL